MWGQPLDDADGETFALNFGLNFYVFWSLADSMQLAKVKCKKNVEKGKDKVALKLLEQEGGHAMAAGKKSAAFLETRPVACVC